MFGFTSIIESKTDVTIQPVDNFKDTFEAFFKKEIETKKSMVFGCFYVFDPPQSPNKLQYPQTFTTFSVIVQVYCYFPLIYNLSPSSFPLNILVNF